MAARCAPDPIHILCCADAGYAAWAGVMLASVLRFDHGTALHIHLLSDGIGGPALQRIAAMAEARHTTLSVHEIAPLLDAQSHRLPLGHHLSRATYARVFFADFLPASIERAIYLDVDILCRGSLRALWHHDLGPAIAAVVRDCAIDTDIVGDLAAAARMARDRHARRLGLPEDGSYFNSGVMLIDVRSWCDARIAEASLQWAVANTALVQLGDQDPLNVVLRDRVSWLDDGWNWLAHWAWREPGNDVRIVHFAGYDKPWHADHAGIGTTEWRDAKAASPFCDAALISRARSAAETADPRQIRVLATAGATTETAGGIEIIRNNPERGDVFVYGPHVALPPGAYTAAFHIASVEDMPTPGARPRRLLRFQIALLSGTKSIAILDIDIPSGVALHDMPVTLAFVLPGPVHDLECWLTASPGLRVELRSAVTLIRAEDSWRTAIAG
jgi:lipopolysaccharide biosynthesis glycosyltransferase